MPSALFCIEPCGIKRGGDLGVKPRYVDTLICGHERPIANYTFANTGNELILLKNEDHGDGDHIHDITVGGCRHDNTPNDPQPAEYTLSLSPDRGTFTGPFPLEQFGALPSIEHDDINLYVSIFKVVPVCQRQ